MKPLMLFFSYLILQSSSVFALSEANYKKQFSDKIIPFISLLKDGSFSGAEGISIHYRTYIRQKSNNCLVILPGRTEPLEKYAEVIYDLKDTAAGRNLNFYLMDHRGQGQSGRMSSVSDMGHVDNFDNYVADLDTFITKMKLSENCDHKFLLAHSLGAGIASAYLLSHPHFFDRVAFSSPMLKIQTKPYAYGVAQTIVRSQLLLGRGAKFAPGQKGFESSQKFEENTFTTSKERFDMAMTMFELFPATKVGGVSNRWIFEVMKATKDIRERYSEFSMPLLMMHAGNESYSETDEMVKLCTEAKNCKRLFFNEAKHEILMERDDVRNQVLAELDRFFNN